MGWDNVHINENHHFSSAMAILTQKECNFLEGFSEEELANFNKLVSALVLGTDSADDKILRESFEHVLKHGPQSACFLPACEGDAILALQIVLKCADLGH